MVLPEVQGIDLFKIHRPGKGRTLHAPDLPRLRPGKNRNRDPRHLAALLGSPLSPHEH